MRTEKNKDGTRKVWMTTDEIDTFIYGNEPLDEPLDGKKKIVAELLKTGIRAGMIGDVCYSDIRRTSDGNDFILELEGTKDTTGDYDGGQARDIMIPDNVERTLFRYIHSNDIEEDEPVVDLSTRRVQQIISARGLEISRETGVDSWAFISPHDFRRSTTTHLIHNEGVQLSVVAEQMGWDDLTTARNYLDRPTEEVLQRELSDSL